MSSITTAESGKDGTVTGTAETGDVGGEVTEFSYDLTVESLEATNMEGGGFFDSDPGIRKCTGSFNAVSSAQVPQEGTVVDLELANGIEVGQRTITGDALITSVNQTTPVQGGTTAYSATFEYRGSFVIGTVTV